jgi:hypothetical protein
VSEPEPEPEIVSTPESGSPEKPLSKRRIWTIRAIRASGVVLAIWLALAYIILPLVWRHYEHNPALADAPKTTLTSQGIPGDPLNVGLIANEEDVVRALHAAGWSPADPITLGSCIRIATSVVFKRPDPDAPVSALYLFRRRQDLAFEKPVGTSADRRHHVRFWKALDHGEEGRAVWLGAVTFDRGVGLSHRDAKITHHIAPDIDAERDLLAADLKNARVVTTIYEVTGIGPTLDGRNGGGDAYFTDGEIKISVLVQGCDQRSEKVTVLDNPPIVEMKNRAWSAIEKLLLPGAAETSAKSRR